MRRLKALRRYDGCWRVMVPARISPTHKRRAYYFKTEKEAEAKIKEIERFGLGALTEKAEEKIQDDAKHWQYLAETHGLTKEEITQALQRQVKVAKLSNKTLRQALEEYQQTRKATKKWSTVEADRRRLLKLYRPFENRQMADISQADLRRWFDQLSTRINTRSVHKSARTFFGWARDHNYVADNPMLEVKPLHKFGFNKGIYQPEVFARMLRVAAGLEAPNEEGEPTRDFIDLLPWLAISGFCGLRNCEAYRETSQDQSIRWNDLYWDRGFIEVRHEVAKRTKRDDDTRHIERPHALAAARAWLELAPRKSDLVVPWTKRKIQDLKREFTAATGILFKANGLRHSFASYALTYTGLDGVGKLSWEMGDSETICKRYYLKRLPPGTGKAWFGIRPAQGTTASNVIIMPVAAA